LRKAARRRPSAAAQHRFATGARQSSALTSEENDMARASFLHKKTALSKDYCK
jgi:hypothetical protein